MRTNGEDDQSESLSRRNVLPASGALVAPSAPGSATNVDMAHAQAAATQSAITEQEAHAIAVEAYRSQ